MRNKTSTSKYMSKLLRHEPPGSPIQVDRKGGWVEVAELLPVLGVTMEELEDIVATDEKNRYSFNADKTRVRANQGHSIDVDMGWEPRTPPEHLYHGTVGEFLPGIRARGLVTAPSGPGRKGRQYVHLSKDVETALKVGRRRGKPVVLQIDAKRMQAAGYEFFLSENGIWQTKEVPPEYIRFPG